MRRTTSFGLALAFLLLLSYVLVFEVKLPVANAALFNDEFANLNNWNIVNGAWTATGGILQGVATNENCLIWAGDSAWTNYQLTVCGSKLNSGNVIGVIVRYTDPDNFYWMGLGCWGHKYSISKIYNGTGTELASSGLISEVVVGRWYMISAVVVDTTLQLFVDGDKVLEVQDNSLPHGAVGFITYNGTMRAKELAVQTTALDPDSWPMWRNDPSHSGYTTSNGPITNQTLWTFTTNALISDAVVANGCVFFGGGDGYFYALNASTGKQVWIKHENTTGSAAPQFISSAVADGTLYVTGKFDENSSYSGLYAFNASTGERIWNVSGSYDTIAPSGTPTVVDGKVYVGYGAFDAYTGRLIWTCLGQPIPSSGTGNVLLKNPAVTNGIVYAQKPSPAIIYALNATNGKEIWQKTTGTSVYSGSSLTIVNGVIYFGDDFQNLNALNATTGEKIWRTQVQYTPWSGPYSFVESTPAVANDIVYVGAYGQMQAVNASTGKIIWSYTTGVYMRSSPAVAGGVVYIGSGQSHPRDDFYYPPRLPGQPFSVFNDNKVYAFNATTGKKIWSYQTEGPLDSSPAIASGIVYVSSGGKLYAFGQLPAPTPTPTVTPTPTSTLTPTSTPSSTPLLSPSPTPNPSPSPTPTPTVSPTPSPAPSPSPTPTSTIIPTPTASPTPSPSPSPTTTPSPTPTTAPTSASTTTVSPIPISTPNPSPTETSTTTSPSPTSSQSLPTPASQPQSTAMPLYLYAAVVLAILAISISIIALITKRRQ